MTEHPPTETPPTLTEVQRAIGDAARLYISLQRARPRDDQAIADAKAELDGLIELRDQLAAAGA